MPLLSNEIPKDIVIIGGGVIGLEFACAYAAFGSKVTVVELMEQVLPGNDKRVVKLAKSALEELGITFYLGDAVESVERDGDRMRSTLRSGEVLESDIVMSAVGRKPLSEGLGFPEAGIEMDRAAVKVDEYFRTNVAGVYAIGDLIGGMMLAHVAEEEGVLAARNAVAELGAAESGGEAHLESMRYDCIPACVYTFPEVAVVGSSRDSAKERGIDAVQAVSKFAANGKALGEGESDGFVQVVAEKGTGRILGCQIVGPHAVEIIHEVAVAMAHDISVQAAGRDGPCAPHGQRGHPVRDGGRGGQGRGPGEQLDVVYEHGTRSKRLPEWLRRPIAQPGGFAAVTDMLEELELQHRVPERASVPIAGSASRLAPRRS